MSKKKHKTFRILCLFDYDAATGFATVSKHLVDHLARHFGKGFAMDIVAINYFGESYKKHHGQIAVNSARLSDPQEDPFGRWTFLKLLKTYDYDLVFIMQDYGVVLPVVPLMEEILREKKKENKKQFKSIFYFPVDHTPVPKNFEKLHFFTSLVTYTEWGRQELYRVQPDLKGKVKVIPHGVDTKHFLPLDSAERTEFRQAYFGAHAGKTIIGNINRNQPRKDIPSTIFAFERYKQTHNQNSLLYLHMEPHDPMGYNLPEIIGQTSLKAGEDVLFPVEKANDIAPDYLNCIYNSLDYYLTTTSGEGWGLSITEAMACKVPVIAPLHTSIFDLAGPEASRLWPIRDLRLYATHFDNMVRYQPDYKVISLILNIVQNHPEQTQARVQKAYEYVQALGWGSICEKWMHEFEKFL